jgi:hypothetical protein
LRKWPLLLVLVAIGVIGCGGGGGNNGSNLIGGGNGGGNGGATGNVTGGSTGRASGPINIQDRAGLIDVYYLPGQGRAPQYQTAFIAHTDFTDTNLQDTAAENPIPPIISLQLDGYNAQNRRVTANVPAPGGPPAQSRLFNSFAIFYDHFEVADGSGNEPATYTGFVQSEDNKAFLSSFQGRNTALQLFLNDGMFTFNQTDGTVTFDDPQFLAQNTNPATGKVTGFLSDYLSFDISNVPNKPVLVNNPGPASKVFVSGDNFALSKDKPITDPNTSDFEVLTPFGTYPGKFYLTDPIVNLKTYKLQQPDPRFPFPPRQITALQGIYNDFTERINSADAVLFIAFPKTGDGPKQDFVIVNRAGSKVNAMWFGTINYQAKGSPSFNAFPIGDIQPASVAGKSAGVLSNLLDANGVAVNRSAANWWQNVRSASWAITSSGGGIPSGGKMYVYRL